MNGSKNTKIVNITSHNDILPIYWHQDRYLDWFIDEDENKNLQKFWGWFLKNIMLYQTKIFINKDMGNSCPKSSDNQGNV